MADTATLVRMEHQTFISFEDILSVSVECSECKTKITVPVAYKMGRSKDNHSALGKCPACHSHMDTSIYANINELTESLRLLMTTKERHSVLLQIKQS